MLSLENWAIAFSFKENKMRSQSKYAAKGKPMPYSEIYKAWYSAVTNNRPDEAAILSEKHRARFGSTKEQRNAR